MGGYTMTRFCNDFALTQRHIDLLCSGRTNITWQDIETGAPGVDPKRPYGNSYVAEDVAEILGLEMPDYETARDAHEEFSARMLSLHLETGVALEIILSTRSFVPGKYRRVPYTSKWERVG